MDPIPSRGWAAGARAPEPKPECRPLSSPAPSDLKPAIREAFDLLHAEFNTFRASLKGAKTVKEHELRDLMDRVLEVM